MVDFTQIAQEYGSLWRYAVLDELFDTQSQVCSELTLKKWQEQLKELEPFMTDHCMAMLFYVGIDMQNLSLTLYIVIFTKIM